MQSGKFLFDREFGTDGATVVRQKPKPKPIHTDDDLRAAREAAYAEGVQAGERQAVEGIESQAAAVLQAVAGQVETMIGEQAAALDRVRAEAAGLALDIACKLSHAVAETRPLADIEQLIAECLRNLQHEPRVVVRAAEPVCEALAPKIDEIARNQAFAGQMVVIPADDLAPGDCRVEWADGGAERSQAGLEQTISEAIARYVASKTSA